MGWKVRNFECLDCHHEWEELYKEGEGVDCPRCGSSNTKTTLSAPQLGKFSMADKAGQAEILKKRSADHTKKKVMKEWKEKNRG